MLGKLLKYELKATSRVFVPLYIAILVVSIVNDKNATIKLKNVHINDVKYFDRTSDLELTGRVNIK